MSEMAMTRSLMPKDDVDYNEYCRRMAPPRYVSPYDADPHCEHAVLIEMTPEFRQPRFNWSLPMGGFVMLIRDWVCKACGGTVDRPHNRELHFKDGKITPGPQPFIPRTKRKKAA